MLAKVPAGMAEAVLAGGRFALIASVSSDAGGAKGGPLEVGRNCSGSRVYT
jgi:hypothetical protein